MALPRSKNFKKRIPANMTSKGTILVLEDSDERIRWLTSILPGYVVRGFERVSEFVVAVNERPEDLRLVVFDHDLGKPRAPDGMYDTDYVKLHWDEDGKNGHDAAMEVRPFETNALVWSHNVEGRKRISRTLLLDGKAKTIQEAAFKDSLDYAVLIGRLLAPSTLPKGHSSYVGEVRFGGSIPLRQEFTPLHGTPLKDEDE